jgi:hypothetical protein
MHIIAEQLESPPSGIRTHLTIGLRQGTASASPKSSQNSGVFTPEVRATNNPIIYETALVILCCSRQIGNVVGLVNLPTVPE